MELSHNSLKETHGVHHVYVGDGHPHSNGGVVVDRNAGCVSAHPNKLTEQMKFICLILRDDEVLWMTLNFSSMVRNCCAT